MFMLNGFFNRIFHSVTGVKLAFHCSCILPGQLISDTVNAE